jgi:hypothetical protein
MTISRHTTDLRPEDYPGGADDRSRQYSPPEWWRLIGADIHRHHWGQISHGTLDGVPLDYMSLRTLRESHVRVRQERDKRTGEWVVLVAISTPKWVRGTKTIPLTTEAGEALTLSRADIADAIVAHVRAMDAERLAS